jgi:Starch-binding associating with outer membrane
MNKSIYKKALVAIMFLCGACDNGFDELNTSKTGLTKLDPAFLLNGAFINTSYYTGTGGGGPLVYELAAVQQLVTPNSGVVAGANYNQDNRDASATLWQRYYRDVIRYTREIIDATASDPARSNLYNMTRILQAHAFMVLTDEYGDIPYFNGGKGHTDQISFPVYDSQADIYPDLIKELTEASAALDATKKIETGDVAYGGDVAKWKKFGYSLLLRAGMRLSKVDPTTAATVVNTAFQGGVIMANTDNAYVRHDNNFQNSLAGSLTGPERSNFYLAAPFVDQLKNTNDPRLSAIAVRYVGAKSGNDQVPAIASKAAADQIGMPMGHNNSTIVPVATSLGLASFYDFTQADRTRITKINAPFYLVTAAQSQLLLAEARFRNWITTGPTAEEHFSNGIKAHMEQMAQFDPNSAIAADAITTYLTNNPLAAGTELEQINVQYWIASFLNSTEAFSNWRRSGFPQLTPNPFPGKAITGDFIRRITYPNSEISVNSVNVNEAISRMGGDNLEVRVWWDKN